jgi:hypothetical protein
MVVEDNIWRYRKERLWNDNWNTALQDWQMRGSPADNTGFAMVLLAFDEFRPARHRKSSVI